ncbi:MAG: 3-hydroxyacyl-ACP dehydratase FabZ [Oligoflexia bacterium]|nr:3-hydroxyacyl-ACP dehydratase FabZ [Oligoflexia bacterium]
MDCDYKRDRDIEEVLELIPQRPPFLFIDQICSIEEKKIITKKRIDPNEDYLKGHFPNFPIVPGVLLCEAIFQSGALFIGKKNKTEDKNKIGVVSRIEKCKFKQLVHPGDELNIEVELKDQLENAFYFSGKIIVNGKVAVVCDFACTLRSTY